MCALSTCSNEAETKLRARIGHSEIEVDVCTSCSKGVIVGTLKVPLQGTTLRTFRVIKDGCPVCAFTDECPHEKNAKGIWVWKK